MLLHCWDLGWNEHPKTKKPKTRPEIPDPIECQGPDIKDTCLFYISCAIFFMSAVFMVLATTRHFPLNKAENMEDFLQPTSDKPGPGPAHS